jgi:hypothetical protein
MIATRPSEIAWLSPDDLRAMGAIMMDRSRHSPSSGPAEEPLAAADLAPASAERPPRLTVGAGPLNSGARHLPAER